MKYNHWITSELRQLRAAYKNGNPSAAELAAMFPRHPVNSSKATADALGLSHSYYLRWLRLAHEHFARRESGLLA